ncbi:hypothetical protein HYV82_02800 [Candidatus Woesearchaeota archaeon]|nr:hypothetical protein [Candidatus Woesearchaeota archaeon]
MIGRKGLAQAVLNLLLALGFVMVLTGTAVFAADKASSAGEACYALLEQQAKAYYGVSFPLNYSEFNTRAGLYSSKGAAGVVSGVPQYTYYVYDFGSKTSWAPDTSIFAEKWKPLKQYSVSVYYRNDTFEGCGFTKIMPLGSYTHSTILIGKIGSAPDSLTYADVTSADISKDGFIFNLGKYAIRYKDAFGADLARIDRLSLASKPTDAYNRQVLANEVAANAMILQLKKDNTALRSDSQKVSAAAQKGFLIWHAVYWAIIIALLALLVRAQMMRNK